MSCYNRITYAALRGFPDSSAGEESPCNSGDPGLIPRWGSSLGKGIGYPLQYSWASLVAQMVKNPPVMRESWVRSLGWKDTLEEDMATYWVFLPGESPWPEEPGGLHSPWGCKESDTTERLSTAAWCIKHIANSEYLNCCEMKSSTLSRGNLVF